MRETLNATKKDGAYNAVRFLDARTATSRMLRPVARFYIGCVILEHPATALNIQTRYAARSGLRNLRAELSRLGISVA